MSLKYEPSSEPLHIYVKYREHLDEAVDAPKPVRRAHLIEALGFRVWGLGVRV